jgi:hypothetical protein
MQDNDHPTWVISLQNAQTGQRLYFNRLEGLIGFLKDEFDPAERLNATNQENNLDIKLKDTEDKK